MCTSSYVPLWLRRLLGLPNEAERQYATPERLADVMALIQVLALDKNLYRSESGILDELKGPPRSAESWVSLARQHLEFFRVDPEAQFAVVLVARHVLPKNSQGARRFSPEFVGSLLQTAVDIHDRQVKRAERWIYLVPIWVAIIGAIGAVAVQLLKSSLGA